MSIPTLILFKDGKPVERIVGYRPKDQLLKQISGYLPPSLNHPTKRSYHSP